MILIVNDSLGSTYKNEKLTSSDLSLVDRV